MELKKLELFGFKSFADRTPFEFDSGITVIVGPNGCGKSNVVDAVKWVLGEQSPKSLRGREMADVIFAGSESRRSLGFAEATLTFDNASGMLPIDMPEVEISRRLYRSGESEYLLNRKPCRLRDIRELFMDTGVGVDAYSLIEQGKVDVLLQSNPHERRLIFEEAAGISKYKAKRKEAERKLARTEQNLLRLGDILQEVERRLRSVKYQAGKARNYKQYTTRLKELRVSYALNQYHEHTAALAAQQTDIDTLQNQRSARSGHLAQLDQQRSALEAELMDLENRVRQVDARLGEVRSALATRDNEIGFHRTRVDELRQIIGRDRRKIGELSDHLREADAAVETRRTNMADVAVAARDQETTVASIEQRLRDLSGQVRNLTGRIEHAKTAMLDLVQERTRHSSHQASLDLRLETLQSQARKLHARRDEIATSLHEIARQEEGFRREGETLKREIADRRGRLEAKRREAEATQQQAEQVGEQFARAKEEASALDSRRDLLEDLERRGEGIPAAVRKVAEAIRTDGVAERWRGMVADLIEVDASHAVVIESALGPAEKLLIADRQADVLALARRLEGQLSGQVRFLALDAIQPVTNGHDPSAGPGQALSACPEAVGWATDYVRAAESVRPAIEHLLARTIVVRTLDGAAELARGPLRGYRFVSLAGGVLEADGSIAIGPPGPETSLISRRSELLAIRRRQEDLRARIERLDDQRRRALEALAALDETQQELRQEVYEASMRKVEVEGRLRRLAETRRQFQTERPVLESELEDLARQRREASAARDATAREIAEIERREAGQQAAIAEQVAQQERLTRRRDACEQERTGAHVTLAQLREKHTALVDGLAAARRDLAATRSGIEEGRTELVQCQQRVRESEQAMLRLQSELATLFMDKESAEVEARRLASDRAERRDTVSALSREARTIEGESDELQQRIHERELQRRELLTKRDDLVSRVRDDFGMDLVERYAQWQAEQVDWDAVAEEIRELQAKIERLGAVNLDAIDEQEALGQRAAFLRKQNDDLVKARETLEGLIDRINHESRQRFITTFDAVRGHFQELFRKLFGGGKADVFLEDEADVLEAGIEVVARPPGKQLQRISLLSGGEKTMTAVALLLAIFRAKPSPFAILDEVDAALDESNVDRFTDLVKEFLDQSQFVIISHNKRTMAIADMLYGVTMQEPGVSRRVSVKFSDLHEHGYVAQESDRSESEPDRLPVEVEATLSAAGARAAKGRDEAAEAEPSEFGEEPEEQVPAPEVAAESPVTT